MGKSPAPRVARDGAPDGGQVRHRTLVADGRRDLFHEGRHHRLDEDPHVAAAGQPDLEGLVVGVAVGGHAGGRAAEDLLGLLVHRRLDAPPGALTAELKTAIGKAKPSLLVALRVGADCPLVSLLDVGKGVVE